MSNQEIILWAALGLVVLVVGILSWASHSANAKIKDYIADEGLLDPLPPRPPLTEAEQASMARLSSEASLYRLIKDSKRMLIKRAWTMDMLHVETTVGEPLAFSVGPDGGGWVTIKKDDGHVVTLQHSIPPGQFAAGMVIVEARFI